MKGNYLLVGLLDFIQQTFTFYNYIYIYIAWTSIK